MALRPLPPNILMSKPLAVQDSPRPATVTNKKFTIEQWDGSKSGEKIMLYAETGMGKSTLASMAPNPVFIGLDDGGRKLRHPKTRELLRYIPDVKTFEDVRGAINACVGLDCETVVVDTGTILQNLCEQFVLGTVRVRNTKGQPSVKPDHIEDYGYGKGYKHLWDAMRLPLLDLDKLIEVGKNALVIVQKMCHKLNTDLGQEYLKEGPELYHNEKNWSVLKLWCEWADHIFRIRHQQTIVPDGKKKAIGDNTYVIDTKGTDAFYAKSRSIDEPLISFSTKTDDSLWQFMFKKG